MPIRHAIWKVGEKPASLSEVSLGTEAMLEKMIYEDPNILSDRWMLIGRQVPTAHGGKIDLLALNQDGQIIVIELKRDLTPREVVAQALDYASWVQKLEAAEVVKIYNSFSGGKSLTDEFKSRFGFSLDGENGVASLILTFDADYSCYVIRYYKGSIYISVCRISDQAEE
ncbi:MAG: endonuclease NucS [Deltaproteobacteria bacterium]|nr:endonuclease NucS [Deltaproteobacteria bacterium]